MLKKEQVVRYTYGGVIYTFEISSVTVANYERSTSEEYNFALISNTEIDCLGKKTELIVYFVKTISDQTIAFAF